MKKSQKEIISEVEFMPIIPRKGVVAFVSFTYDKKFRIQDCAIVTRPQGGYRLSFPIKTLNNGKTIQSIYPISKELGNFISDNVLKVYENFIKEKVKG